MRMFSTAVFGNSEDSNRGGVRSSGPHHLHSLREGNWIRQPQIPSARPAAFGGCVHRGLRGLWHSTDALAARADPSTGQAPAWQARQQADRRGPTCAYPSWWPGSGRHHQFAERRQQRSESQHNAQQIAHAPQPAMRSPNAEPEVVPSASDAERPMPDARGDVPGSTEGE